MNVQEQPKDMREHNAWGLFSMQAVKTGGFAVLVHDVPIVGPVPFEAAHELFIRLIKQTTALDGNARALAIAWGRAADESENARVVQERCTALVEETRVLKARLQAKVDVLYQLKFALEQDLVDSARQELIAHIVEALDKSSIMPAPAAPRV